MPRPLTRGGPERERKRSEGFNAFKQPPTLPRFERFNGSTLQPFNDFFVVRQLLSHPMCYDFSEKMKPEHRILPDGERAHVVQARFGEIEARFSAMPISPNLAKSRQISPNPGKSRRWWISARFGTPGALFHHVTHVTM